MTFYQGRALRSERSSPVRPRRARFRRVAQVLAVIAASFALAHMPWGAWRAQLAGPPTIRVKGARTLDPSRVIEAAALDTGRAGRDLLAFDLARIRQRLLGHPRIAEAAIVRRWPRTLELRVTERRPVLLVRHGTTWEMDSAGVLLAPPDDGLVADAPLLSGVTFDEIDSGTRVSTPAVQRALAWTRALEDPFPGLLPQVSEVDVAEADATTLVLIGGTRVRAPGWPPGRRELSALGVVLGDLKSRHTTAREIDLRFKGQVIVRPLSPTPALAAAGPGTG